MKGVKKDVAREKWKPDCETVTPALLIPTWVFFLPFRIRIHFILVSQAQLLLLILLSFLMFVLMS